MDRSRPIPGVRSRRRPNRLLGQPRRRSPEPGYRPVRSRPSSPGWVRSPVASWPSSSRSGVVAVRPRWSMAAEPWVGRASRPMARARPWWRGARRERFRRGRGRSRGRGPGAGRLPASCRVPGRRAGRQGRRLWTAGRHGPGRGRAQSCRDADGRRSDPGAVAGRPGDDGAVPSAVAGPGPRPVAAARPARPDRSISITRPPSSSTHCPALVP